METNFFGPVFIARAFASILAAKHESVLVDVHSVASWYAGGGARVAPVRRTAGRRRDALKPQALRQALP